MNDWPYGYDGDGRKRIPRYNEEGLYQSAYEEDEMEDPLELFRSMDKFITSFSTPVVDITKDIMDAVKKEGDDEDELVQPD